MAVHSRHPIGPPPTAPARESTGHLLLRGYTVFVLFVALATTFWYNLVGFVGLGIILAAATLLSVGLWISFRPLVDWRRLPWFAVGYVAWATASLLWTQWLDASLITWAVLVSTTLQGIFVATVLSWRELVRAIASALKWVMGLSLAFEVIVWFFVRHPVLPNFLNWDDEIVTELYWSRMNLFDWDARIQGIVGNAHLLAIAAVLAIVVFGVRLASGAPRPGWLIGWIVLSTFLLWRSASATAWLCLIAAGVVLGTILLMRTTSRAGGRTKWYALYAGVAVVGGLAVWFGRDLILGVFGKSSDLTARTEIWDAVWMRIHEHPVIGWGFSTPWIPWEPQFSDWIIVNDLPVFHAHNMWLDALFQLGIIGTLILALAYFAFIWRSWFFATDRPRWDLVADRPYQALTVLPSLVATILLVQGLAESRPLMEWGWMFLVMFAMKIKQSPLVGAGPAEQRLSMERGERIPETR